MACTTPAEFSPSPSGLAIAIRLPLALAVGGERVATRIDSTRRRHRQSPQSVLIRLTPDKASRLAIVSVDGAYGANPRFDSLVTHALSTSHLSRP